jgi:solute carrier family 35 protein E1
MDAANVYAVMNIISAVWTLGVVAVTEAPTFSETWNHTLKDAAAACKKDANGKGCFTANDIILNVVLSGVCFYLYNEFAFAFTAKVGPVTSSVLNTLKRVIIIVVTAIVFGEAMDRNAMIGSGVAILGTMFYSRKCATMRKLPTFHSAVLFVYLLLFSTFVLHVVVKFCYDKCMNDHTNYFCMSSHEC